MNYFGKTKFILNGALYFMLLNFSRRMNKFFPAPLLVNLEITKRCNLRCIHCDIRKTPETYSDIIKRELTITEIKKLIDSLKSFGTKYLSISGGEPFLRKDIFEIIRYSKSNGLGVHLSCNGTMITKNVAEKINDLKLDAISISLDAASPGLHDKIRGIDGAFDMAVTAIDNLVNCKDKHTQVGISPIITDLNLSELPEIVNFASEMGVDAIRFQPWHISLGHNETENILGIREERLNELDCVIEEIIKRTRMFGLYTNTDTYMRGIRNYFSNKDQIDVECFAGSFTCNINWLGEIFPCAFIHSMGCIRNEPFEKIWKSRRFNEIRTEITSGNCQKCWMGCFIEPSLRCSVRYAIQNPGKYINDLKFYYR
jgi:MoaA/NifB/PqqE/SkfB family radical SAM enzyme